MWIIKIIKIKCFYPPRILDEHCSIYSCLQIPPRENWFQYVRRVYATAINFPSIITLALCILYKIPLRLNRFHDREDLKKGRKGINDKSDIFVLNASYLMKINCLYYCMLIFKCFWRTNLDFSISFMS